MSRAKELNKLLEETPEFQFPTSAPEMFPYDLEGAKVALEKRISMLGIEGVQVLDMDSDEFNNIKVMFADYDDNVAEILFSYSDDDGARALVVDPDKGDDEDDIEIDLDPLAPSFVNTANGPYINMLELAWLSKHTIETILTAGSLMDPAVDPATNVKRDAVGNITIVPAEGYEYDLEGIERDSELNEINIPDGELEEVIYKIVVRGGKKVRRPLVRRKRRKRLTSKQRAGLRKAGRTRKSAKSKMKRKRSLVLRKRLHLKPGARKGFRVG